MARWSLGLPPHHTPEVGEVEERECMAFLTLPAQPGRATQNQPLASWEVLEVWVSESDHY